MVAGLTWSCQKPKLGLEREVWEFFPREWLFYFGLEQYTLPTDGKIVLNFRIYWGHFFFNTCLSNHSCSLRIFHVFLNFLPLIQNMVFPGGLSPSPCAKLKARLSPWELCLRKFPSSGLGPLEERRGAPWARQLQALSAASLATLHWLWGAHCSHSTIAETETLVSICGILYTAKYSITVSTLWQQQ